MCKCTQSFLCSSPSLLLSHFLFLLPHPHSEASQTWQELLGSSQLLLQSQLVLSRHSPAARWGWIAGCKPKPSRARPQREQHTGAAAAAAGGSLSPVTTHAEEWGQGVTPDQARSDTCMAVLTPPCAKVGTSHLSKAHWAKQCLFHRNWARDTFALSMNYQTMIL